MSETVQWIVVGGVVAAAVVFLAAKLRGTARARSQGTGCEGCSMCKKHRQ